MLVPFRDQVKMTIFGADDALGLLGLAAFNYFQLRQTPDDDRWYKNKRPPWGPPSWLYGGIWSLLYAMTTVAGYYFIKMVPADSWQLIAGFTLYTVHMAANKLWSVFFWAPRMRSGPLVAALVLGLIMIPTAIGFLVIAAFDGFYLFAVPVVLWSIYLVWLLYALALNIYWVQHAHPTGSLTAAQVRQSMKN
jgi:tryptophan-rich sensory protein